LKLLFNNVMNLFFWKKKENNGKKSKEDSEAERESEPVEESEKVFVRKGF